MEFCPVCGKTYFKCSCSSPSFFPKELNDYNDDYGYKPIGIPTTPKERAWVPCWYCKGSGKELCEPQYGGFLNCKYCHGSGGNWE